MERQSSWNTPYYLDLLGTSRERTPSKIRPPSTQSFCSWPTICFIFLPRFPTVSPQPPKALLVLSAPPFGQPLRCARDPGLRWAPLGQRLAACEGRRSGGAAGAGAGTGQLGRVDAGMGSLQSGEWDWVCMFFLHGFPQNIESRFKIWPLFHIIRAQEGRFERQMIMLFHL